MRASVQVVVVGLLGLVGASLRVCDVDAAALTCVTAAVCAVGLHSRHLFELCE